MPAQKISLDNAKIDKLFYFVANVVVWRPKDGRCLILKRATSEKVHPNKWCVLGGKLEWADLDLSNPTRLNGEVLDYEDAVEKLLIREVKEEAGIEIQPKLSYVNSVAFIRPDEIPVILVKFAAEYKGGEISLEPEFSDYRWVDVDEARQLDCIQGIPEEIAETVKTFRNS